MSESNLMEDNLFYRWILEYSNARIDSMEQFRVRARARLEDPILAKYIGKYGKFYNLLFFPKIEWDCYIFKAKPPKLAWTERAKSFAPRFFKSEREKIEKQINSHKMSEPTGDNLTDEQKVEKRKELGAAAKKFADHFWEVEASLYYECAAVGVGESGPFYQPVDNAKDGWLKYIESMATQPVIDYLKSNTKGNYGLLEILEGYEKCPRSATSLKSFPSLKF